MIIGFKESGKFLYHYTKLETAKEKILAEGKLRFSRLWETNDPKEKRDWEFGIGSNENADLEKYNLSSLSRQFSEGIKKNTHLLCFCQDADGLTGDHLKDIFLRGFTRPRMWAQYGGNHQGVCLVFEKDRFGQLIQRKFKSKAELLGGEVTYRNRDIIQKLDEGDYMINVDCLEDWGMEKYINFQRKRFAARYFFEKMTDWRDEREFRFVLLSDSPDYHFVEYNDSLKGIIFGEDIPENDEDDIILSTEHLGLDYMRLKWKNCSPWYFFEGLKYSKEIRNSPWSKIKKKV